MTKDIKIVFMGTPNIAAYILEGLINEGYKVIGVVAQMDKPVGRKQIIEPVPSKVVALKYNIPVFQPVKIRLDYEFMKELNPDLIITCAYGQIVPQGLLDIPKYGCLNVHGSLLPKYRGAAPVQEALFNGDKVTGVTIMEMIDKMDAGRMYHKKEIVIEEEDNYTTLMEKVGKVGLEALLEMLPDYLEGKNVGEVQNEDEVSFCSKVSKEKAHLDLNLPKEQFVSLIRGLSYTPGAYLELDDTILKIYKAHIVSDEILTQVGEIVKADKNGLHLQLVNGIINLDLVQKQAKSMVGYKDFVNGNKVLGKVLK